MQQRHVGTRVSRGMPAKEMVVMLANLAGTVVVADVVIVSLRQRHVDHAETDDPNQEGSQSKPVIGCAQAHVFSPCG